MDIRPSAIRPFYPGVGILPWTIANLRCISGLDATCCPNLTAAGPGEAVTVDASLQDGGFGGQGLDEGDQTPGERGSCISSLQV